MRTIKFRAWTGEYMISPDHITRDGKAYFSENSIPGYLTPDRVMQFSGLIDKNGRDIYEGDIMDFNFNGTVGKVTFLEGSFGILTKTGSLSSFGSYKIYEGVVIGNIYENPDLISDM